MKLNKSDREAFVAAVMDDVPKVDYDALAQKLATELMVAQLPEIIQRAYNDPKSRQYVQISFIAMPGCLSNFYGPSCSSINFYDNEELKALSEKLNAQNRARGTLRENLSGIINSCSTLERAKERLPEFEKYLPTERDGSGLANLPAVANVVAELTKAGWPKGQERAAA